MKTSALLLVAGLVVSVAQIGLAAPIYFAGTNHWYEAVEDAGIGWDTAKTDAAAMTLFATNGYLATVTSQAENDFIRDNLLIQEPHGYWIGGEQPQGSAEPAGSWQWDIGEPWAYTNWDGGEPNDAGGNEDGLEMYSDPAVAGMWNDLNKNSEELRGYIVEYPVPEPGTMVVLVLGSLAALLVRRPGCSKQGR